MGAWRLLLPIAAIVLLPIAGHAADASLEARVAELERVQVNLDHVWTTMAAALVFLMQAGFLLLEAGLVRSKNSINVAQKNIADMVIAVVVYGAVGFMVMFGASVWGVFGFEWDLMVFDTIPDWTHTFFFFQVVFVGTAATIVSGAVAERMRFNGYLLITVVISGLIYPVFGHMAWGNLLISDNPAFLADQGFIDFAGSTVVHSVGGWLSLAGVIVLGPRIGRFTPDGRPVKIQGHSPVLATTGALLLWVGWIGFNGGSTTAGTPAFAHIVTNTVIAGAMGGCSAMLAAHHLDGLFRPDRSINGVLGGLVAITAGCDAVEVWGAVVLGLSGGLVALYGSELLERVFRLDDAVGAIAVHGLTGAWGTILLALLAPAEHLAAGGRLMQLLVQVEGVVIAFVWAFGVGYVTFRLLDRMKGGLRVSREHELAGLNEAEHGTTLGTGMLLKHMTDLAAGRADITVRLEESMADEAGELGYAFNRILENLQRLVQTVAANAGLLTTAARDMTELSATLGRDTQRAATLGDAVRGRAAVVNARVSDMAGALAEIDRRSSEASQAMTALDGSVGEAAEGAAAIRDAIGQIELGTSRARAVVGRVRAQSAEATDHVDRLAAAVSGIGDILSFIEQIAGQTNLLALNATIEAARAGSAGKGFAVVASEVKSLATQTATAVDEIRSKIEAVRTEATDTGRVIAAIDDINREVDRVVEEITAAVTRQTAAAETIVSRMETARTEARSASGAIAETTGATRGATDTSSDAAQESERIAREIADSSEAASASNRDSGRLRDASSRVADIASQLDSAVAQLAGSRKERDRLESIVAA